ncbi:exodeoxyribonuclease VIII [Klebsiella oxytoca]|uniref:RecE family exodeoxyribonuclease n=1 Tax=Klebsiella oxytoca TaxID=571 RepID=UPI001CCEEF55|nr:RecE family exodeoxyribonuclease [Klebsiella oxytoca]MBZ7262452.1 exodeoxyribonuclease VIII [Klebsiella oxytoca]
MSGTVPYFIHHKAKKLSGEPSAVFWKSAKSETRALRDADNALEDAEKDPANYFKAVVTNFPVVDQLPSEGQIDFTFCNYYQLGDDGMTWVQIPGTMLPEHPAAPPKEEACVTDSVITSTAEVVKDQHDSYDELKEYNDLTFEQKVFGTWLFGQVSGLNADQKQAVSILHMDTDATYPQNVFLAANDFKFRQFRHVFPETMAAIISDIKSVWPIEEKAPRLDSLLKFFGEWLDMHNDSTKGITRESLVEKWQAIIAPKSVEEEHPSSPVRYKRAVTQNMANLGIEVATAQLYPDAEPGKISRPQLMGAKGLVDRKEDIHVRAMKVFLKTADILDYDTQSIFGVTRAIKWNGEESIAELKAQVREWLSKNGIYENGERSRGYPEWDEDPRAVRHQKTEEPTREDVDKMLAAQRGEFVPGISDPDDPKWVKTDVNQPQEEKELVENMGNGIFDVSALLKNSSTHDTKKEVETTSNVQIQESDSYEEQAGDEVYAGKNDLDNGEETGFRQQTAVVDNNPESTVTETERQPSWPTYFEPGRYENIPNEIYHTANGISSSMLKDARISLMYFHGRHVGKTIPREETKPFIFGRHSHAFLLEPDLIDREYAIPNTPPEGMVSTTAELKAIVESYNSSLPAPTSLEEIKEWIDAYNNDLTPPLSLSGNADEIGLLYLSLPEEYRRLPAGEKHTATAMKSCIKEYNSSLTPMLKTSGGRDALLDQIASISPEFVESERAKLQPYNVSGSKAELSQIVREIRPDIVLAEDFDKEQEIIRAGRTYISLEMYEQIKAMQSSVMNHHGASRLINHPDRQSEVSYFGIDEATGLEVRVRPDIEIPLPHSRIGADLKTCSLGHIKQERLRDRLHREIIERDYHLSAAMYCDVASLDDFYWIFVNKDPGYHWVAVVQASTELLELGRYEYRRTLRKINEAMDTNNWPAPIVEDYTDNLNDFDLRRLEALMSE